MKYLINHSAVNADQIVAVEYTPEWTGNSGTYESGCQITLTSTVATTDANGWPVTTISERINLCGTTADRFWAEYISDAYTVISPKVTA